VDEGPRPNDIQRVPGILSRGQVLPVLQTWYLGESWVAKLGRKGSGPYQADSAGAETGEGGAEGTVRSR
jgi:hypothetical protein